MKNGQKYISIFIYLLMGYTILQFFWWTYLIFELNAEIISLEKIIVQLSDSSHEAELILAKGNLDSVFFKKKMMILGESGVFLIILLTGFYLIKRSHDKELDLARQEQNFMLAITHELNSPLAAIKLNIETLLKRQLPVDKVHLILRRMEQESERLNHMVNNILATSRMEKKGFELFPEQLELSQFVKGLVKKYDPFVSQDVIIQCKQEIFLDIDPLGFELVFQNLIENASKYSESDSVITISLSQSSDFFCLKVKDQGIGISDNEKSKVLAKFYRVGEEGTRKSKGTGLGLFLVNNLVHEMNGKLSIHDNSPTGTIFSVEIPC